MAVETVQTGYFGTDDVVKDALLSEQLADACGDGGEDHLYWSAEVDGKLHLINVACAGTCGGLVDEL
ncbi:hypothetical protein SDC9_158074 [bioreactor metagenome]|uniref:Uncharacterized protein n=1 Tax=bioreactor metagenome TaxID=1076179 RepID=A0A645F972_9ZZZZ